MGRDICGWVKGRMSRSMPADGPLTHGNTRGRNKFGKVGSTRSTRRFAEFKPHESSPKLKSPRANSASQPGTSEIDEGRTVDSSGFRCGRLGTSCIRTHSASPMNFSFVPEGLRRPLRDQRLDIRLSRPNCSDPDIRGQILLRQVRPARRSTPPNTF